MQFLFHVIRITYGRNIYVNSVKAEIFEYTRYNSMIIISNLKERRLSLNLSKNKVSKLTGMPRQSISLAESGKTNITVGTYNKLDALYSRLENEQK